MQTVKTNIFLPLARRLGTFVSGALVANVTISPETAVAVETAVAAIALLAVDLFTSYRGRN